jgi:hypothetical protein
MMSLGRPVKFLLRHVVALSLSVTAWHAVVAIHFIFLSTETLAVGSFLRGKNKKNSEF